MVSLGGLCLKEVRLSADRVISSLCVKRLGDYEVFLNMSPKLTW